MTRPPEWLLDGYLQSGIPEFVEFAERCRSLVVPPPVPEPLPVSQDPTTSDPKFYETGRLKALEGRLAKTGEKDRSALRELLDLLEIMCRGAYQPVHDMAVVGERAVLTAQTPELAANGWPSLVVLDTIEHRTRLLITFDLAEVVKTKEWPELTWETTQITSQFLTFVRETQLAPQLFGDVHDVAAFLEEEKLYLTMILADTVIPERPEDQILFLSVLSTFMGVTELLAALHTQLQASPESGDGTSPAEMDNTPELPSQQVPDPAGQQGFGLNPQLLELAGLTHHGEHAGLTTASWVSGGIVRRSGLFWQEAEEDRPYPLLTCINSFILDEDQAQEFVMAAVNDHFMQMTLPSELVSQVGKTWLVARTLTPAIHGVNQDDGKVELQLVSSWPLSRPPTPAVLRFCTLTSFGQALDLLIRSGQDIDPDLVHPGPVKSEVQGWLNADALLKMVGDELTWKVTRGNEIQCQVAFPVAGETREFCLYLRFVDEGDQEMPIVSLRGHTLGSPAQDNDGAVAQYLLEHSNAMRDGRLLPVTVDRDGDLCVRQIILCPEEPTISLVWPLVMRAVGTLNHAIGALT